MRYLRLAALSGLVCASIVAQVAGRVNGSVVDATGGAVPGAKVILELAGSSVASFSTVTNTSGDYVFISVRPETYDVVIEAPGFTKSVTKGLKVDPGVEVEV